MTTQMLQEIGEASEAVARQLGHNADLLAELGARLRGLDPPLVATIARGSSDCCALYLKYLVEIVSGAPCASIGPSIATLYRAPMRPLRRGARGYAGDARGADACRREGGHDRGELRRRRVSSRDGERRGDAAGG